MGLQVNRVYINPLKSDGTLETSDGVETTWTSSRGVYTLASGTTYFFPLPVDACTLFDVHMTHDNTIIITSATIETCSHGTKDVTDFSAVAGEWIDQDPSTAFVGTVGAGDTAVNGVGAVAGGNAGGLDWQVSGFASARARLKVVVAGTGGEVRVSFCGKE